MCDIVVKKFTFAISSPDEFLFTPGDKITGTRLMAAVFLIGPTKELPLMCFGH